MSKLRTLVCVLRVSINERKNTTSELPISGQQNIMYLNSCRDVRIKLGFKVFTGVDIGHIQLTCERH